jgi:1-deoxy-D-xylulose-5-phosphate reductoisomerase
MNSQEPIQLVLLGATGSIGESTLKVLRKHPNHIKLTGIACNSSTQSLINIAREFKVPHLAIFDEKSFEEVQRHPDLPCDSNLYCGMEGLEILASLPEATHVLFAMVGIIGLQPALACIEKSKKLILANKEILVLAGGLINQKARQHNAVLIPADSEHNAIHQCLGNTRMESVNRLLLTASGGQFRNATPIELENVTLEQALQHPNWDMGPKVTIDSSTMANKGLEIIEAHWLFNMPAEKIQVVVHPQSIVHSMVEFKDGSILAQLSPPEMTFALQNAIFHPHRLEKVQPTLDFRQPHNLEFYPPDEKRFPCLRLAREALLAGGVASGTYNAANEIAVQAFINKHIPYMKIPEIIEKTLENIPHLEPNTLEEILAADNLARAIASELIQS